MEWESGSERASERSTVDGRRCGYPPVSAFHLLGRPGEEQFENHRAAGGDGGVHDASIACADASLRLGKSQTLWRVGFSADWQLREAETASARCRRRVQFLSDPGKCSLRTLFISDRNGQESEFRHVRKLSLNGARARSLRCFAVCNGWRGKNFYI